MGWLLNYIANAATRFLPPEGWASFFVVIIATGAVATFLWHRKQIKAGRPGVQNWQLLVAGIGVTWIFLTLTLGAASWAIYANQSLTDNNPGQDADAGPLRWYFNLEMEGGPPLKKPVFALAFFGSNRSQKEVLLKSASIVSGVNGRKLDLEVEARDDAGRNALAPLSQINLVPPGSPIKLIAKFGDPDPAAPDKVFGLDPKVFLETWSKFVLIIEDDTRSYRIPFNEGNLTAFFPGMVGPRITKK